jgi:arginine:pyruvate transaminase
MTDTTPPLAPMVARLESGRGAAWGVTLRGAEMRRQGRSIIDLGVGDPDFATPPVVVDAAVRALAAGRTHYAPADGETALREAVARHASRDVGAPVGAERVHVFPGAQCALFAALMCTVGPGDEVVLLEPAYTTYERCVLAIGAVPVSVPLDAAAGFALDVERIAAALTSHTRAVLVNSPGNPSGAVFGEAALASLVRLCRAHGLWLISDEVYGSLVFEGRHHSPLAAPDAEAMTVVVDSLSKSHAMTGWRIGWTIAPPPVARALRSLSSSLLFGVNQFVQDAAAVALDEAMDAARAMTARMRARRDLLCDGLDGAPGIHVHRPAGGMFVMLDIAATGQDGIAFADGLLDEEAVVVIPGAAFGDAVRTCLRVGLVAEEAMLVEAAGRLARHAARVIGRAGVRAGSCAG